MLSQPENVTDYNATEVTPKPTVTPAEPKTVSDGLMTEQNFTNNSNDNNTRVGSQAQIINGTRHGSEKE